MISADANIAVIGLGYVGLPLAVAFGMKRKTIGYDISHTRVEELSQGKDRNGETEKDALEAATHLTFTSDEAALKDCQIFIITVPTPITEAKQPDLTPLLMASQLVGRVMSEGAIVIYESTVYPGCVRDFCVPVLEQVSGLKFNQSFFAGYSPERINPGDKTHTLANIVKVTSGSTPEVARAVDGLYASIITAGTFLASSMETAEAAKVIENTQRDLNIAFMNELAILFNRLGLDTSEVLEAAGTKWNFLRFLPGLVGGHCIGVDPYYLTHRAQQVGYHPEMILAGRRLNDHMGHYIAERVVRLMLMNALKVSGAKILVLGLSFKENCPDLRNSRVIDIITTLQSYHADVEIYDPWVDSASAWEEYGVDILQHPPEKGAYEAVILAVAHKEFAQMGATAIRSLCCPNGIFYDVKSMFDKEASDERL